MCWVCPSGGPQSTQELPPLKHISSTHAMFAHLVAPAGLECLCQFFEALNALDQRATCTAHGECLKMFEKMLRMPSTLAECSSKGAAGMADKGAQQNKLIAGL